MKHVFIVNKISGKGQAFKLISTITDIAQQENLDYQIELTQHHGHAKEIASRYHSSDICLYSVGGDGTLLEVLNGLDQKIPLAVIPAGSGNDFYRMIGEDHDYRKIIRDSLTSPCKKIDIGMSGNLRFLNTTSFGIDADINAKASALIRNSYLHKGSAYLYSIFTNVLFPHAKHMRIIADGVCYEDNYYLIACMNGRYYGNGILVSPESDPKDGFFELCLLREIPRLKIYPFLMKYMHGNHIGYEGFQIIKAKHIVIDADKEISCQSDGENYSVTHIELKIKEHWLTLKVPPYLNIL